MLKAIMLSTSYLTFPSPVLLLLYTFHRVSITLPTSFSISLTDSLDRVVFHRVYVNLHFCLYLIDGSHYSLSLSLSFFYLCSLFFLSPLNYFSCYPLSLSLSFLPVPDLSLSSCVSDSLFAISTSSSHGSHPSLRHLTVYLFVLTFLFSKCMFLCISLSVSASSLFTSKSLCLCLSICFS